MYPEIAKSSIYSELLLWSSTVRVWGHYFPALQATTTVDVELALEVTREKRPEETLNLFAQGQ